MKVRTLLLMLGAASCTALAQPAADTGAMQPKTENGITYLCGGVGLDESNAMKQAARDYDLMSTFAAQDGSYLADVKLEILGKDGNPVLQTTCDGPMLLAKLPQGNYRVRATVGEHAQTKAAHLGAHHGPQRLVFVWPAAQAGLTQPRATPQPAAKSPNADQPG